MEWGRKLPLPLRVEHVLDLQFEGISQGEGQGERGVVFAGFHGIDGLAGDADAVSQLGLAPAALGTQDTETVLHRSARQ